MKKIILTICIVLSIVTASFCLVGCNARAKVDDTVDLEADSFEVLIGEEDCVNDMIGIEPIIKLSTGATVVSDASVTKTVTAIVEPVDNSNTDCDWSIDWLISPDGNPDISEYFSIETSSSGLTKTCNVTCYKAFLNAEAVLTCTLREGGYSATCSLKYVGRASKISVQHNGTTVGMLESNEIKSSFNETLHLEVVPDNIFGVVDPNTCLYSLDDFKVYGKINLKLSGTGGSSSVVTYDFTQERFVDDSIEESFGEMFREQLRTSCFAHYSKSGANLTVSAILPFEDISIYQYPAEKTGYCLTFDSYHYLFDVYLRVTVKELYSNSVSSFNIVPIV